MLGEWAVKVDRKSIWGIDPQAKPGGCSRVDDSWGTRTGKEMRTSKEECRLIHGTRAGSIEIWRS